ncbi:MAG: hypothetical protein AAF799_04130 [Myxococcota bacterium]
MTPRWIPLVLGLLLSACDDSIVELEDFDPAAPTSGAEMDLEDFAEPQPLVDVMAWREGTAEHDPLHHERPDAIDCPVAAWGPEWGRLEIQTGVCNYLHVTQPSLTAIEAGDSVELVVFHDRLDAAEPAQGHVAILVGEQVLWEHWVDIPTEAAVVHARVPAPQAWPVGAPVGLHLHNHGYNSWTLAGLEVLPGGAE